MHRAQRCAMGLRERRIERKDEPGMRAGQRVRHGAHKLRLTLRERADAVNVGQPTKQPACRTRRPERLAAVSGARGLAQVADKQTQAKAVREPLHQRELAGAVRPAKSEAQTALAGHRPAREPLYGSDDARLDAHRVDAALARTGEPRETRELRIELVAAEQEVAPERVERERPREERRFSGNPALDDQ